MPFRHISPDLKERAVWLKNNGWLTGNICAILGISDESLRRWCQNVEQFGNVVPVHNPLRGRPSTLDAFQVHELIEMLNETPELFLDEIRDWVLVSQDVGLSRSAINKIIEDLGFTYKYMKKVAVERDKEGRRQWMEAIRAEFVAEQMVFVDESSKDDRTIFRRWGRAPSGKPATIEANFVRGTRYSIIASITMEGYLSTRIVEGSVDGPQFFDYIAEQVVSRDIYCRAELM
jgi:transposase